MQRNITTECLTWNELADAIRDEEASRHDVIVRPEQITATTNGRDVCVAFDGAEYEDNGSPATGVYRLTEKAISRAGDFSFFHGSGSSVLHNLTNAEHADGDDAELATALVNNSIRHLRKTKPDAEFRFRLRVDENFDATCRSILSAKYAPVDHSDVVSQYRAVRGGELLGFTAWNDWDDLMFRVAGSDGDIDGGDSLYNLNLTVSNGLTGTTSLNVMGELYRLVCTNGLTITDILGTNKRRHVGTITLDNIRDFLETSIEGQLANVRLGLNDLTELRDRRYDDTIRPEQWAVALSQEHQQVTRSMVAPIVAAWKVEPEHHAAGVINAMTRAAQGYEGRDRFDIESFAGTLCSTWTRYHRGYFDALMLKAKSVNDDTIAKVLSA